MMKNVRGENNSLSSFFEGKKVFLTGHTGFKGSWLSLILHEFGAKVCGVALEPLSSPNLYDALDIQALVDSNILDICDLNRLGQVYNNFDPDIVIHMAAQALVSKSFQNPVETYQTNVMGTVSLFETIRNRKNKKPVTVLNVTTDKVYKNNEWDWPYREIDELDGSDPYSNSKSCVELVTNSYFKSFFKEDSIKVINVRAGNVIGGGDFSENRIVPDCINSLVTNQDIHLRSPNSVRPFQHVFEPLFIYLELIKKYYELPSIKQEFNIGPSPAAFITVEKLSKLLIEAWPSDVKLVYEPQTTFKEAKILKLDSSKIAQELGWTPKLDIFETVKFTTDWYKTFFNNPQNIKALSLKQIAEYTSKYYE